MFSLKSSLIICCLLFIPFFLKTIGIEVFPAIELPSGGMVVKEKKSEVKFKYSSIYGVDYNGNWLEIDKRLFFYPIPIHYSANLLNSDFGLDKAALRSKTRRYKILKKVPILNRYHSLLLKNPEFSEEDINERNEWLVKKMTQQNMKASAIKVVDYVKSISTTDGEIKSIVIVNEKVIEPFK